MMQFVCKYLKVLSKYLFNVTSTMEFVVARKTFHIQKNKNDQTIKAIQIHSTYILCFTVNKYLCTYLLIYFSKIEFAFFALCQLPPILFKTAENFTIDVTIQYSQTLGNMTHSVWWKILDVSRFFKSDKHGM